MRPTDAVRRICQRLSRRESRGSTLAKPAEKGERRFSDSERVTRRWDLLNSGRFFINGRSAEGCGRFHGRRGADEGLPLGGVSREIELPLPVCTHAPAGEPYDCVREAWNARSQ